MRGVRVNIRISVAQWGSAQRARLHGELYIIIIINTIFNTYKLYLTLLITILNSINNEYY